MLAASSVLSQTDDVRSVTGLPIPIGQPVIYGQVAIRGLPANEPRPLVNVSLLLGGVQADRTQTSERGFYYFLRSASDGAALLFEVNGNEVGRVLLTAGSGSSVRRDIEINWQSVSNKPPIGVVSAKNAYIRSPEANKTLDKAMAAKKDGRAKDALELFRKIITDDPKDFVTWTEIGSLYFEHAKYVDAEFAYGKALEQRPDFTPALMNLGKLYLSQKTYDLAIEAFLRAANSDASSAEAYRYLGTAYLEAKKGSKAAVAFNEALRLQPNEMAEIHLSLAALYDAANEKGQAANEYKLFLARRPAYPDRAKLEAYIKANPPKK